MSDEFVYALKERIGNPTLFSGRQQELQYYLDRAHSIEKILHPDSLEYAVKRLERMNFLSVYLI